MASPNFDNLNIRLSRMMDDAVAAATTNGDNFTSAYRDQLLNNACRRLQLKWAASGNEDALRGYDNVEAQSLVSSTKALSSWTGNVLSIFSVYNATDEVIVYPAPNLLKEEIQTGDNLYLRASTSKQYYYLNASSLVLIGGTATSSIRLTYAKIHTDLAANDAGSAGDVVIPAAYWEVVLREAAQIFYEQNPSKENVVKMQTNG